MTAPDQDVTIGLSGQPTTIILTTPDGDQVRIIASHGRHGAEVAVNSSAGRSAVWVESDLVAGGEDDD